MIRSTIDVLNPEEPEQIYDGFYKLGVNSTPELVIVLWESLIFEGPAAFAADLALRSLNYELDRCEFISSWNSAREAREAPESWK